MDRRPTMLIVDDLEVNREVLKNTFEDEYLVVEACGGLEAIEYLQKHNQVSIVLLDIRMPEVDGFEVLRFMKSKSDISMIPVVMNTQYGEDDTENKALSLGASDFITIPYNPEVVKHRVQNIISKQKFDYLRYYVERDQLTGIYNRDFFAKKTAEMLQDNLDKQYVLITSDIQRFKVINELFGTDVGDKVLKVIANKFESTLKGIGTYGRLEADNFAFCFPYELFDLDYFKELLKNCLSSIDINYDIAVYIGIYPIDDITIPVDQMCDRANLALLTVKGKYINRYAFYDDEFRNTILQEQQIIGETKNAMEQRQFCVFLQPIFSASTHHPISAEALVRWKHPVKGMLPPNIFIPLFERNGLILKLDYYVWEEVCRFLREEIDSGRHVLPVSVNVSRMHLYLPNLCEIVTALVVKYNLDPSLLKLEITESAYKDNPEQLINVINSLRSNGFQIYMDDFGTGYSSLNMLKDVPVDVLKIDRGFISELDESERAESVLCSVIRMAKWLEMDVIAEGVETKAQLEFLSSVGCDSIQGFYYSKPLPIDDFRKLMDTFDFTNMGGFKKEIAQDIEEKSFYVFDEEEKGILSGMIGAVGIYELTNNILEIVRVNNSYYNVTGSSSKTLLRDTKDACSWIYEKDCKILLDACYKAKETKQIGHFLIRRYHQCGRLMLLDNHIRYIGQKGNQSLFCIVFNEVSGIIASERNILFDHMNEEEKQEEVLKYKDVSEKIVVKKVLIVDDNQINRSLLRKILADEYEVLEAENGRKALEMVSQENNQIVVILLDIVMPIMNGYDFLEARNKDELISSIPVIVLDQGDNKESEIKALQCGANDFMKKPFDDVALKNKIDSYIKIKSLVDTI